MKPSINANNYYPSSGNEGMLFIAAWCDLCYKQKYCTILSGSLLGKHPKQWLYDKNNIPSCTSFSLRPKTKRKQQKIKDHYKPEVSILFHPYL